MLAALPGLALLPFSPYCGGRGGIEGKRYTQPPANQTRPLLYLDIPSLHPKHPGLT